ncbi:HutD family protein [Streptomyces sp. NPDC047971]|uniref:HutD/Ves family protein n=1 Tax=Streptomyces sp. NPDC047971 TaxID=3154499 RepID=UPI0033EF1C82
MHRFDTASLTAGRWRNGGGTTREIVSGPAGAGEFGWRASVADIDRDGPFSAFAGVDRTLTLLAGDGVRLACPGVFDRLLTRVGEPFAFSGDHQAAATLPGGACRVLNIMVRRGRWTARVEQVTGPLVPSPGHAGVLYVLRGQWHAGEAGGGGGGGGVMTHGQGVWWAQDDHTPGQVPAPLSPDATALWADITPTP